MRQTINHIKLHYGYLHAKDPANELYVKKQMDHF